MRKLLVLVVLIFGSSLSSLADSPITSIFPAKAYSDIAMIKQEIEDKTKELSVEECEFLFASTNPMDQKFAFINALGWGDTTFVLVYSKFLVKKYGIVLDVFDSILTWRGNQPQLYEPANKLTADDYSCLAYLQVSGNYFAPLKAYYCAYKGAELKQGSEAAAYIYGLVMSQFFLGGDWCRVFSTMESIRNFDAFDTDRIRQEAINNIFEYIGQYESSCTNVVENKSYYNKPSSPQKMEDKKNYVDLVVVEIKEPEYFDTNKGTKVIVRVKNVGTISSIETNAMLSDLDISVAEAKKRKFPKLWIDAIKENNSYGYDSTVKGSLQGDLDWTTFSKIPILQPGEEVEIQFLLDNYWIYDPNCEMELFLDFDKNIEEKKEDNNSKAFVAWG